MARPHTHHGNCHCIECMAEFEQWLRDRKKPMDG